MPKALTLMALWMFVFVTLLQCLFIPVTVFNYKKTTAIIIKLL